MQAVLDKTGGRPHTRTGIRSQGWELGSAEVPPADGGLRGTDHAGTHRVRTSVGRVPMKRSLLLVLAASFVTFAGCRQEAEFDTTPHVEEEVVPQAEPMPMDPMYQDTLPADTMPIVEEPQDTL
jgi:hypothetical protein